MMGEGEGRPHVIRAGDWRLEMAEAPAPAGYGGRGEDPERKAVMLGRDEVIREACAIVALAYHSLEDYHYPSDGFCDKCPNGLGRSDEYFRNAGHILDYVREAVLRRLRYDGKQVAAGFDPETGRERREP